MPVTEREVNLELARELENEEEFSKAIAVYQKILSKNPLNEEAYNRMMIVYRKQKELKKELTIINMAIKAFQEFYNKHSKTHPDKKVQRLSKSLQKVTGLLDKRGNEIYQKEPIGRWLKRKKIVQEKIKNA